jgi:Carboxypeptidase regulatory-like domain
MTRANLKSLYAAPLTLLLASFVLGQSDRGVITGDVTDKDGSVIAGATVTVTNTATNIASIAVTTSGGRYTVPALPVGAYKLRVERSGFKTASVDNVTVNASTTTSVDVTMEVGDVSQTVDIVAATGAQVQTENAKISSGVTNKLVEELPLVVSGAMRNAFDLAVLTPEARPFGTSSGAADFSIGGGQGGAWGITLDGVNAGTARFGSTQWASVNTPSLEGITEFTVDTNGFKAEYGRASGGNLSFASKGGTNQYHGSAYEFLRNNVFDARSYFEDRRGVLKQHDFGWSFGGPVWIPKIYKGKDKTFFFSTMEWFRNRRAGQPFTASVPTPEMYTGDFSKWVDRNGKMIPIYDPSTTRTVNGVRVRDPFPGNQIPDQKISPFAKQFLALVRDGIKPTTTAAPGTFDYVNNNFIKAGGTSLDPWTKFSVRGDHTFSEKNKISGLYNYGYHGVVPGPDGFPGLGGPANTGRLGNQRSDVFRLNWTRVIRPNIVNSFIAGGNNWRETNSSPNATGSGWKSRICLPGVFDCDFNMLRARFAEYAGWGESAGDGSENTVYSFGDDLSIVSGRHAFKMGYLYERLHYNGFGRQTMSGEVSFSRLSTSVPGDNNLVTGGGNSFASFLLGEVFTGSTENNRFVSQQWRSHSMYFQDDWKITPKLTLNLGVRYEFTLPPLEGDDKWSDFTPDRPNPNADNFPGALRFAGNGKGREGSRTLVPGWYGGVGPRFGFAYSLNDKTVIRGGAARSFGVVRTTTGSTHFDGAIVIFGVSSDDNGITPVFKLDNGFIRNGQNIVPQPPSTDPGFGVRPGVAPGVPWWQGGEAVRLPESYDWTLSVQRQVTKNMVFETSYNATIGAHLVANLLNYQQLPWDYITRYGASLLNSQMVQANGADNPAAVAAGVKRPYPSFRGSVAQALRLYPQYGALNTGSGHGDKSGHSTYHALVTKLEQRLGNGLTLLGSYVFSKLITDTDEYGMGFLALDHYNRRLEKSVGNYDLTHNFKFSYIYELPFGKGKKWLNGGVAGAVLGGWRFSAVHLYSSGTPIGLGNSQSFPIFGGRNTAYVTSLDGWNAATPDNPDWRSGATRYFVNPCGFVTCNASGQVTQPGDRPGDAPRRNSRARREANLAENFSLAKTFSFTERFKMDFRWEAFNAFNRAILNPNDTNVQSLNFGRVTSQANDPRRMQFGLKLTF